MGYKNRDVLTISSFSNRLLSSPFCISKQKQHVCTSVNHLNVFLNLNSANQQTNFFFWCVTPPVTVPLSKKTPDSKNWRQTSWKHKNIGVLAQNVELVFDAEFSELVNSQMKIEQERKCFPIKIILLKAINFPEEKRWSIFVQTRARFSFLT